MRKEMIRDILEVMERVNIGEIQAVFDSKALRELENDELMEEEVRVIRDLAQAALELEPKSKHRELFRQKILVELYNVFLYVLSLEASKSKR